MNTNTIQQETVKTLPQLKKGSATYKLIVPEKVEEKIRYLIRKFPHTEWSGVLFITHEGTFENNDLVITCQDIYPMDLGTSGWTEFKMSEDVAAYMADNIELFDCDMSLCHSHHTLGAFFSGQDNKMLQQEGNDTNCFVSLVVDTPGNYVARVTRKVQTKSEVTIKNLGTSYEFFGEGSKDITKENSETTQIVDKEYIEYFDLEVERHEVTNSLAYLDARFDEIEKKKSASKEKWIPQNTKNNISIDDDKGFLDYLHEKKEPKEGNLFNKNVVDSLKDFTPEDKQKLQDVIAWKPNPKKIHRAVCNMLTCNLIINPDKFDLKQWIHRHMVNVYERIFDNTESNTYENVNAFAEWRDFITQFTMDYFDVSDAPDEVLDNYDLLMSTIAEAIYDELSQYANGNMYIQSYQDAIEQYIVQ